MLYLKAVPPHGICAYFIHLFAEKHWEVFFYQKIKDALFLKYSSYIDMVIDWINAKLRVRQIVALFVDNVILLIYHLPTLTSDGNISTWLSKDNAGEQPVHIGK